MVGEGCRVSFYPVINYEVLFGKRGHLDLPEAVLRELIPFTYAAGRHPWFTTNRINIVEYFGHVRDEDLKNEPYVEGTYLSRSPSDTKAYLSMMVPNIQAALKEIFEKQALEFIMKLIWASQKPILISPAE